jgi:plastocyanin
MNVRPARSTFRVAAILTVSALPSLALAACSSDGYSKPAGTQPAGTQPAGTQPAGTQPAGTQPAGTAATPTSPAAGGAVLTISEFAFSDVTVAAGTEITITNNDGFAHTVTDSNKVFDVRVESGASEPLTIAAAGTYSIVCKIHPRMKGTITVI